MTKITKFIAVALVAIFSWHFFLTYSTLGELRQMSEDGVEININPITNVVSVRAPRPLWADERVEGAIAIMERQGPALIEKELNDRARGRFNIYAMLLQYHVDYEFIEPSPEAVAAFNQAKETDEARMEDQLEAFWDARERHGGERQTKEQAQRDYLKFIELYNIRVGNANRHGEEGPGVFGVVKNTGERTLENVRLIAYYLNEAGDRIGEKTYSPVLSTEFSFDNDGPLRPGYERNFGFWLADEATPAWSGEVEVEVLEVRFSD